jgi:hypothetical protein
MPDLQGFIDMHIHTSPDVRARKLDDINAARAAVGAGMAGIVLKSHVTQTADRAAIAQSLVPGIRVYGGLALNQSVGGINPYAVETALDLGVKIIWLPTISAQNHRAFHGEAGGISLIAENDSLTLEVIELLDLLCGKDVVLATGHISAKEIMTLIPVANEKGVMKLVITHPEVPWINLSIDQQSELLKYGVYFERCFASTFTIGGGIPLERITTAIDALGAESTIISTDFGAASLAEPVNGFQQYISKLSQAGFSADQIYRMGALNPANLLGMDGI